MSPLVAIAIACPVLLCQCKTTAGSFKNIEYDPATLKTPDNHGMEKKEYPFDDDGTYRKDWVKSNSSGRTRSSYDIPDPAPATGGAAASATVAPVSAEAGSSATVIAGEGAAPEGAMSAPAPAEPRYHRVGSGDTLFSLAQRYGTSVDDLKRVNGLTSDSIRAGQSLRIP